MAAHDGDGLPRAVLEAAFDMDPAEVRVVPGAGEALVVRLDTITPVNADEPQVAQLGNLLRDRAANSVSQDLFNALNADIQSRAGVTIDQSAINAVLSNFR